MSTIKTVIIYTFYEFCVGLRTKKSPCTWQREVLMLCSLNSLRLTTFYTEYLEIPYRLTNDIINTFIFKITFFNCFLSNNGITRYKTLNLGVYFALTTSVWILSRFSLYLSLIIDQNPPSKSQQRELDCLLSSYLDAMWKQVSQR